MSPRPGDPQARAAAAATLALRVALALVLAYIVWLGGRLALHDSLTSVADDSSNYLVMARHLSPWAVQGEAIRDAWALQYFPPLFPLLLAATGAAHSLLAAHALVLALGVLALYALHLLLVREMGLGRTTAAATCMLVGLLPGYQLGLQGVLSESLYLLLSLLFLRSAPPETRARVVAGAVWLGAAMLTRSAGLVLLLAVLAHAAAAWAGARRTPWKLLALAAAALALHLGITALFGARDTGEYLRIWHQLLEQGAPGGVAAYVLAQAMAMAEAWMTFLLVYWSGEQAAAALIAVLAGVTALAGMLFRLRANRIDGWYSAGMLAMLLLWPYPGQMLRLLFPVVPILLAQGAWLLARVAARYRRGTQAMIVAGLAMTAVILPSHAWLHGRLALADSLGLVPVYEWLRKPDPREARRELGIQNQMLEDFARLGRELDAHATIATHEPSYVALLAARTAFPAPWPVVAPVPGAQYLFLTAIHPRRSRTGVDGLALPADASAWTTRLWCSRERLDGLVAGCLYRIGP